MAKQVITSSSGLSFLVYSRHAQSCPYSKDRAYLKCSCWKWVQFQQDKKTIQQSAHTRSMAGLQREVEKLGLRLSGKAPSDPTVRTVEAAVKDWLAFREKNGMGREKTDLMGRRLTDWCAEQGVSYLHEITSEHVMQFRNSLPYRTTTSSSLKVYWSVMCSFFGWATGLGLIAKNPVPNTKLYPEFKIKFKTPEVKPPTAAEIEKVMTAVGEMKDWDDGKKYRVRLFMLTMRWSGAAVRDTATLLREKLDAENRIKSERTKTGERFKIRIPAWLAEELRQHALRKYGDGNYFFWDGTGDPRNLVLRWLKDMREVFHAAGVRMTSHKFRHFRITELLKVEGWSVDDVATMVGTSPKEIRHTYEHWITEDDERVDRKQAAIWLERGLDKDGNPVGSTVQ